MNGLAELPETLFSLAVAFVLGIPVGWERDRHPPGPGVRTFPLLAMGACAYIEIGQYAFRDHLDAQARVFQALVSGVGFIGAGAIIKGPAEVRGLANAVSLWVTVSVGIAAAFELYPLAGVLVATEFVTLHWLRPLMRRPKEGNERTSRSAP